MDAQASIRNNEPFLRHPKKMRLQSKVPHLARQLLAFFGQAQALQHFLSHVVWLGQNAPLQDRMSTDHRTTAFALSVVHATEKRPRLLVLICAGFDRWRFRHIGVANWPRLGWLKDDVPTARHPG